MVVFAWHESALVLKLAVIELAILFRLTFPSFPVASVFPSVEKVLVTWSSPLYRCRELNPLPPS